MNDLEKAEIKQNKAIRGYIIRCLVKGYNNTALTRQLSNAMIAAGLIISPDISKYLDYLQGAGYIEFTEEKVTAYNAYANDLVISGEVPSRVSSLILRISTTSSDTRR